MDQIQEFHYKVRWRSQSAVPGPHLGTQPGGGFEDYGHSPLLDRPDPRRLDIRASLHDPYGHFLVRTFRQRSAIPVFVIADLSASMGFETVRRKMKLLAEFSGSVAYTACRTGDRFGFIGSDSEIIWDFFLPLQVYKDNAADCMRKLRRFHPAGTSVLGLREAAHHLGKKRALVFLVSDFHFPIQTLTSILDCYVSHDVVPIVLWDSAEFEDLPKRGLVKLQDPETGEQRTLFMRPSLYDKIKTAFEQRRALLIEQCLRYGREPFFMLNRFDASALTQYFTEH